MTAAGVALMHQKRGWPKVAPPSVDRGHRKRRPGSSHRVPARRRTRLPSAPNATTGSEARSKVPPTALVSPGSRDWCQCAAAVVRPGVEDVHRPAAGEPAVVRDRHLDLGVERRDGDVRLDQRGVRFHSYRGPRLSAGRSGPTCRTARRSGRGPPARGAAMPRPASAKGRAGDHEYAERVFARCLPVCLRSSRPQGPAGQLTWFQPLFAPGRDKRPPGTLDRHRDRGQRRGR